VLPAERVGLPQHGEIECETHPAESVLEAFCNPAGREVQNANGRTAARGLLHGERYGRAGRVHGTRA